MCTLTEYRRPKPKYATGPSPWAARTGWELVDGRWSRWYRNVRACGRHRVARVFRARGGWTWRVEERDTRLRWREVQRGADGHAHFTAQAAMPFAELAAATEGERRAKK